MKIWFSETFPLCVLHDRFLMVFLLRFIRFPLQMYSNSILLGWIQLGRYFGTKKAVLEKEEEEGLVQITVSLSAAKDIKSTMGELISTFLLAKTNLTRFYVRKKISKLARKFFNGGDRRKVCLFLIFLCFCVKFVKLLLLNN